MHSSRTTVWCGVWAGGVIRPFFFEIDERTAVTLNGERYRDMISTQLWPNVDQLAMGRFWFQHEGATCHTSRKTLALLDETFSERVISLHGKKEWSPRSCNLRSCDFFLWGFVKFKVYADKHARFFKSRLKSCV